MERKSWVGYTAVWQVSKQPTDNLELIVVIVDISSVPVRARVTWAGGGVFIIVVLAAVVSGASMVHPVRQVSLQPLVRGTDRTS